MMTIHKLTKTELEHALIPIRFQAVKIIHDYIKYYNEKNDFELTQVRRMFETLKGVNYGNYSLTINQRSTLDRISDFENVTFNEIVSTFWDEEYKEVRADKQFNKNTKTQICKAIYDIVVNELTDVEYELRKRLLKS